MNITIKFRKILPKTLLHRISRMITYNSSIYINKKKIIVPILKGIGLQNLFFIQSESFMGPLIKSYFSPNELFIDVGSNVGQTLIKFKAYFEDGYYIGFEPNPNCASYLYSLIQANRWFRCKVIPVGLFNENSFYKLLVDSNNMTGVESTATFVDGYRGSTSKDAGFHLPSIRLDDYYAALLPEIRVSLIKIDVEGGELYVLEGMQKLIMKFRPNIIVEVLPSDRENRQLRQQILKSLNTLINRMEYSIFNIIEYENAFDLVDIEEIPYDKHELINCNYLLLPTAHAGQ